MWVILPKVPLNAITDILSGRSAVLAMLEKTTIKHFDDIVIVMKKGLESVIKLDKGFEIDFAFATSKQLKHAFDNQVREMILSALPDETVFVSMETAYVAIQEIEKNEIGKFMSEDGKAKIDTSVDIVGQLMNCTSPDKAAINNDPFYTALLNRISHFCKLEDDTGTMLSGVHAVKKEYRKFADVKESSMTRVEIHELRTLRQYKWLLDSSEQKEVSKWVVEALKLVGQEIVPHESKGKSDSLPSNKKPKKKADVKFHDIAKYFG